MIDHICVATSKNQEDDKISIYAESKGLDVFRGSLNDVSYRALEASKKYNYDSFLRVCADRPFLDSKIYDDMINIHKNNNFDITTNIFPRTVPPGLTGEIININALEKMLKLTNDPIDKEHVTRYFYQNPKMFKIYNCDFFDNKTIIELRLVIDDMRDLERSRWIASNLKNNNTILNETKEIISLAKQWEINNKTTKL